MRRFLSPCLNAYRAIDSHHALLTQVGERGFVSGEGREVVEWIDVGDDDVAVRIWFHDTDLSFEVQGRALKIHTVRNTSTAACTRARMASSSFCRGVPHRSSRCQTQA